jgi:hypothetical protein
MGATKHFHTCRIDDPHEKNGRGRIDVFSSCSAHQRRCMWHPQYAASNCPLSLGARIGLGVSRKALSPLRSQWTFNPVVPGYSRPAGAVSPHRQRVVHGLLLWMSLEPRSPTIAAVGEFESRAAHHCLPQSAAVTRSAKPDPGKPFFPPRALGSSSSSQCNNAERGTHMAPITTDVSFRHPTDPLRGCPRRRIVPPGAGHVTPPCGSSKQKSCPKAEIMQIRSSHLL